MRSKEHLQVTYQQQLANWQLSQELKLKNLETRRQQQLKAIQRTQTALDQTEGLISKIRQEQFPTFDEFFRKIELQSANAKRTKNEP